MLPPVTPQLGGDADRLSDMPETTDTNKAPDWFKLAVFGVCTLLVMLGLSLFAANAYNNQSKADAKIYVECVAQGHSGCAR
jgi:hypothetical protein